jgi:muramoyltetrapeptide carboxypeptidase
LEPLKVPVLAGLPLGHQPDNHTLPLGARARLDSRTASLSLAGLSAGAPNSWPIR